VKADEAQELFLESLDVIRRAWKSEERFTHIGKHWTFQDIVVEPPPIQRPHPPLWLAAGSEEGLNWAAQNEFNLLLDQIASFDTIQERFATYRGAVEAAGRTFDPMNVAVARALHITRNETEREEAHQQRSRLLSGISRLSRIREGGGPQSTMLQYNDTRLATEEGALIGPPEEIIDRLQRMRDGGIEYVLLIDITGSRDSLRTFRDEVMPALQ